VVSQGSTAGVLAIAGDPVFRFCPPDKVEGAAIANTIFKSGIKGLVTLARNDAGNLGLQTATDNSFTALGGHISALDAYSTTITDFTTEVSLLRSQVDQLTTTYGSGNVGIYLASFDECTGLFEAAANDPVLSKIHWYGGDGVVLSTVLTANAAASDFAIATSFYAPTFGLPQSLKPQWQPIADNIKSKTGIEPDAFALAAYDAMWVIAHTLENSVGKNLTFAQLKAAFAAQANAYTGITGPTALDTNGDRASGDYDYYGILKTGSTYGWTVVGESE
jgi:branched-chain amino acid transport system substrate-binding protein